jgi:hypothetical protein
MRGGLRAALRAAWGPLRIPLALLAVYLLFMLGAKGLPADGPYTMSVGKNVLVNLRTYSGLAFSLWLVFPAYGLPSGFTVSHAIWIGLAVAHVMGRRLHELAFGVATFLLLIAPVLFTSDHTHSFHVYVAALGAWFLVATAIDQLRSYCGQVLARRIGFGLILVVLAVFAVSVAAVRKNVAARVSSSIPLGRSFVLRRAMLADLMCRDIKSKVPRGTVGDRIILLYPFPEYAANWRNVYTAMGNGSAVRLLLDMPELDVIFAPPRDLPRRVDEMKEVLYYTELGRCYTAAEWARYRVRMEQSSPVALPDSTSSNGRTD